MKECQACGGEIRHRAKDTLEKRAGRKFCSQTCANRNHAADPIHLRFWRRVGKSPNGCWMWKGSKDGGGYGTISTIRGGAPAKAHRLSWEMRNGPIPDGIVVCHRCDTPACVNPDHLFLGTQRDNMRDCSRKGRINPKSIQNLRRGAGQISMKEKAFGQRHQ